MLVVSDRHAMVRRETLTRGVGANAVERERPGTYTEVRLVPDLARRGRFGQRAGCHASVGRLDGRARLWIEGGAPVLTRLRRIDAHGFGQGLRTLHFRRESIGSSPTVL